MRHILLRAVVESVDERRAAFGRNQWGRCRTRRNSCATGFASVLLSRGKALAKPVAHSPVAAEGCAAYHNSSSQTK